MPNVNNLLRDHVVLKYEMVDRIFLNGYVAKLQEPDQLSWFLSQHRGQEIPRYELLGKMTRDFVAAVEHYALQHRIPLLPFQKGQRKEAVALPYFRAAERQRRYGVVLIGVSQERANVFRPPAKGQRPARRFAAHRNAAFVKYFYVYIRDHDFGPGFIRVCTYAPFSVRVCLNGHQWLVQRLRMSGHQVEQLDNGIASVDDPEAVRRLCRRFGPAHIQRFFDRWISYLPNPFSPQDRAAQYTYQLSTLQLEISDTRVFDRPLHGRQFFEEVIREHLDLGRPDQIQLVFGGGPKRSWRQPPRTRVFAAGVHPSLQIGYRNTRVKQYWKLNRAVRTETTSNDTYHFGIGRKLENLPRLIEPGREINHRLLELEMQTQRPTAAARQFEQIVMPSGEPGHRVPGLRFGDPRVVALFAVLARFALTVDGFRAGDLRPPQIEAFLAAPYSMPQMAYDLRRLRLNALITRTPHSQRYQLTAEGQRMVPFCGKLYTRAICGGLRHLDPLHPTTALGRAARAYDDAIHNHLVAARLCA